MFTGIVESLARVEEIKTEGTNKIFFLDSPITGELHVNQSLSHNGVCLTITDIQNGLYSVTAVQETLIKSMSSNYRFDGHIVQGHVDQTGICSSVETLEGSWLFDFSYDFESTGNIIVEKGSVCVNGVSLTAFNCKEGSFRVTIIPFTWEHTNFKTIKKGDKVNLEFDIIGKYIQKMFSSAYQDFLNKKLG